MQSQDEKNITYLKMSFVPPNKEWMNAQRWTEEYIHGVDLFLQFTKDSLGDDDWYCCPCVKCRNMKGKKTSKVIREHLICDGIDKSYKIWFQHGEPFSKSHRAEDVTGTSSTSPRKEDVFPRMVDMVNDTFGGIYSEDLDECMNENLDESEAPHQVDNRQDVCYNKLMEDAIQPLYPLCRSEHTKLSVTVELLSMKSRHSWSNKSFTELLQMIKKILPDQNTLPDSTYTAKKLIKSLRMDCEIIHACPNDCILYWREYKNNDSCPCCGESRWKPSNKINSRYTRLPRKKLRYFPLTPRLQRLYSVPWIAEQMTWHGSAVENDTHMRHPMDSPQWKLVNRKWSDFATDKRNVRLGLVTDGFNPFGNKNNSYSCWPVMIVPYNLPPSLCMRKEFTMLSLLIPGKNGPGHNIDVYLQPLIAELNVLWSIGADTYDSNKRNRFMMKAILLWAIHDFPAYGHLSGCRTAGKYGCPVCSEKTDSMWLSNGKKFAYMGHRRFLTDPKHPFRLQKTQFNGKEENGKQPYRLSGTEVLNKMESIQTTFGKLSGSKRKKHADAESTPSAWSKRSILFDLPYWKDLHIRHNLDVMHVEKNVTENLLATIMDVKGKTKDGLEARLDLKAMKIRRKLWPVEKNGKLSLPKALFCLSRQERELICQTLCTLKVPIGYSANWKHNVNLEEFQLKSLKSHDYHILMQQLLLVLLMHAFKEQKPLRAAIYQLSKFFDIICSKVIARVELSKMKTQMVETLCILEKYFPPSFFVSMTHLLVHLADEALICGPVRFRWMFPFERMMKMYKSYVGNQTYPEGCITERYLMEESMSYCMEYMPSNDGKGGHKAGQRMLLDANDDCANPVEKKGKNYILDNLEYQQARRWVLQQSPENSDWEKKYEIYKEGRTCRGPNRRLAAERVVEYIPWLRQQLENSEMSQFKRLAAGPDFNAISYNAYAVNGYLYCTKESEMGTTTQNSGVAITAITSFRASRKDKNLVEDEVTYYGIVNKILELNYYDFKEVVFFCDWVRIEDRVNGCVVDPETNLIFVNLGRFKSSSKEDDEPFIVATQARQVFYVKDLTRDNWHIALDAPKRLHRDVDAYEDPLVFEARMNANALITALVDDIIEDDVIEDNEDSS